MGAATCCKPAKEQADEGAVKRRNPSQSTAVDPDQFDGFAPLFESHTVEHSPSYLDNLWRKTDEIYNKARSCSDNHRDESAWINIVDNVLESADLGRVLCCACITPKADLALAFCSGHPAVAAVIEPVLEANPELALSQMTNAYTSMVPLVCCLEVQEQGGDYDKAIIQLGIWCAGSLERLRGLWERGNNRNHAD
ncbi:hypothetical protein LCER1_G000927 [Lachnellula cervina]|uniref:PD-(D/E)XK nuclease-like domain-containing protein n=1 Tax=Lachnellula cervina TaxID=1316786 RepID=A0A7D8UV38_9HELO|nr:hypothetical protein LCER1_G000927 [Lachnellula cervina]